MDLVLYNPSKWKTWILSILSLTGISLSTYYLQKDFTATSKVDHGAELGRILACDSNAKRKHADSYLWSGLTLGQGVYLKDSIRVGPQGYATIELSDGSKIELGENSLVIIDDPKKLSFKFVRGSFIIADSRGERAVSVAKDGQALEHELFVKLVSPTPAERFFTKKDTAIPVALRWEFKAIAAGNLKEGSRILIARDRLFQSAEVISEAVVATEKGEWRGILPAGRYYWKIMGANENLSEVRDFTIVGIDPLVPLSPGSGDKIVLFAGQRNASFRWIPSTSKKKSVVLLEVSRSDTFSPLHLSQQVDSSTGLATIESLEPGEYFWRLRSALSSDTIFSRASSFSVTAKEKVELVLKEPEESATLEIGPEIRFSWNIIEGNFDYLWEVQAPEAERPSTLATKGGSLTWTPERAGKYRWRVITKFNQENVGTTPWRDFQMTSAQPITLLKPEAQEKIRFWDKSGKVKFVWAEQSGASGGFSYRLKIATDVDLKNDLKMYLSEKPTWEWQPEPTESGNRFWMVEWLGKNGEAVRLSGVRQFSFGMAEGLAPPVLQTPLANAEIPLVFAVVDPELTWSAVDRATTYEVTILKNGKPWLKRFDKEPHHRLSELTPGRYRWSVRAVDVLKRKSEASALRDFVVTPREKLRAPAKTEWEVE